MINNKQFTQDQIAATCIKNNLFVEAGPGSGKTTILVHRFLQILAENPNLEINNILAITFTTKAASEMLNRIKALLGSPNYPFPPARRDQIIASLNLAKITTIHGFCSYIIRKHPQELQLDPCFNIVEPDEIQEILLTAIEETISDLITNYDKNLNNYLFHFSISQLQKDLLTLFQNSSTATHWLQTDKKNSQDIENLLHNNPKHAQSTKTAESIVKSLGNIFFMCQTNFKNKKQAQNKYSFQDLLLLSEKLLSKNKAICKEINAQYQYILVDEFQDVDPIQWNIINMLQHNNNLFLVGDALQSIYSFRGADNHLFQEIKSQFSEKTENHKLVQLKDNFRSQEPIISFVNTFFQSLFSKDPTINFEALKTKRKDTTSKIEFALLPKEKSFQDESEFIATWIKNNFKKTEYKNIAILCRRKKNLSLLKECLILFGIPATVYSPGNWSQSTEILDLFNITSLLIKPYNNLALIGVLKSAFCGLSDQTIYQIYSSFPQELLIDKLKQINNYTEKQLLSLSFTKEDAGLIKAATENILLWINQRKTETLSKLQIEIIKTSSTLEIYNNLPNGEQRAKNIEAYISKLSALEKSNNYDYLKILSILETALKSTNNETAQETSLLNSNTVSILTIHSAKGLEFPTVIIAECGQKFNFSARERIIVTKDIGIGLAFKLKDKTENLLRKPVFQHHKQTIISEEMRLFFVACTRAKDNLLITGRSQLKENLASAPTNYIDFITSQTDLDTNKKLLTLPEKNLSYKTYFS
jgi:ATP-dependent helicase/nuclease subunit A